METNDLYFTSMAQLTTEKLETNYGERLKREARDQQALKFAKALMSVGGTFEFTPKHREDGLVTIFEAMAADLHEIGANTKTRMTNSDSYEHLYRQGCAAFTAKMLTEWDSCTVYSVPRHVNDKAIAVITIFPDLIVNREGQTAREIYEQRETKRTAGQMTASAKKLTRVNGKDKALATLNHIVESLDKMVELPRGTRMHELGAGNDLV